MSFTTEEKELRKLGVIYKNEKGEKFINRQFFSVAFLDIYLFQVKYVCAMKSRRKKKLEYLILRLTIIRFMNLKHNF